MPERNILFLSLDFRFRVFTEIFYWSCSEVFHGCPDEAFSLLWVFRWILVGCSLDVLVNPRSRESWWLARVSLIPPPEACFVIITDGRRLFKIMTKTRISRTQRSGYFGSAETECLLVSILWSEDTRAGCMRSIKVAAPILRDCLRAQLTPLVGGWGW